MKSEQFPIQPNGGKQMRSNLEHAPEKVRQVAAQAAGGNKKAEARLKAMAAAGGRAAAETRALNKARKQAELDELTTRQARSYSLSPEGDVLPPDPAVIEALEEVLARLKEKGGQGEHAN